MTNYTVDADVLYSARAEDYFTNADRRVMIGLRAGLELLGLPLPDYAIRRKPGWTPALEVQRAFRTDYPEQRRATVLPRRANASPEVVAAARNKNR